MKSGGVKTSCSTCDAEWGGNAGHCGRCHRTFSGQSAADKHYASMIHAGCLDPAEVFTKAGVPKLAWNDRRHLWQHYGEWTGPQNALQPEGERPPRPAEAPEVSGQPETQPYAVPTSLTSHCDYHPEDPTP